MPSITQEMRYRLSAIKCAERYGVKKAAMKCHTSPASIYRWRKSYGNSDADIKALGSKSRRPKSHPNAHTEAEIALIYNLKRRNPNIGLQDLWIKAKRQGLYSFSASPFEASKASRLYK